MMGVYRTMNKSLLFCLVFTFFCPVTQASECTKEKAQAAENAVDHLNSWAAVYDSYVRYSSCDEGSSGEGQSEAVIRLLADQWRTLPALDTLVKRQPAFEQWVLSHIDSTLDSDDLQKTEDNAKMQCPSGHAALCKKIAAAASEAINES